MLYLLLMRLTLRELIVYVGHYSILVTHVFMPIFGEYTLYGNSQCTPTSFHFESWLWINFGTKIVIGLYYLCSLLPLTKKGKIKPKLKIVLGVIGLILSGGQCAWYIFGYTLFL